MEYGQGNFSIKASKRLFTKILGPINFRVYQEDLPYKTLEEEAAPQAQE